MPKTKTNNTYKTKNPLVLILVSSALHYFAFGAAPLVIAPPSVETMRALAVAAAVLTLNHTWLMTATELTRARYGMFATPDEWRSAAKQPDAAPATGVQELARHHNAHRNATENSVLFVLLALAFAFTSPSVSAANTWLLGFAVSRVGHAYGFLRGRDDIRGLCMTTSLLAMYGLMTHLVVGLW